ncbi:MAG: YbaN family protein [Tenericutes bacterium]|nr:YbaN family protein [Mycoplasmatota bacterium]
MNKSKITLLKILYIILGMLALALGTIGIFLPVLPTVPFYLATTYFFAKGSERFHQWFISTKLYEKHVSHFVKQRTMSFRGVVVLMVLVSAMLIFAIYMVDSDAMAIVIWVLIATKYAYFITRVNVVSQEEYKQLLLSVKGDSDD